MTKLFSIILIISTINYSASAESRSGRAPLPSGNPVVAPSRTASTSNSASTTNTPINTASANSQKKSNSASVVSYVMGGGLILGGGAIAASNCLNAWTQPMCWIGLGMVAMGVLSTAQGLSQKQAADKSGISGLNSSFSGAPEKFVGITSDGRVLDQRSFQDQIKKGNAELEKFGAKVDTNTGNLSLPDGQSASLSGSASDIAKKLGLDEEQAKLLSDEINKQKQKGLAAGNGAKVEMIASASSAAVPPPSSFGNYNYGDTFGERRTRAIAASKTTGLTKNVGGDKVGIAQDNIFQMVRRKYEDKKSESYFLESDWGF